MSTIEENKTSLNYIELEGAKLLELLEGASTHADKGASALHALNTVQLEGAGGDLIARATDRYRLIEGATRYLDGSLDASLIALDDIKRTITLLKAHKLHLVNIHRVGNAMTVSALGDSVTFTLVDANYPPTAHLFAQFDNPNSRDISSRDIGAIDILSFNPSFFADYAKIVGKGNPVTITFIAKNKPMLIGLGGDKVEWRALLMPMTIKK